MSKFYAKQRKTVEAAQVTEQGVVPEAFHRGHMRFHPYIGVVNGSLIVQTVNDHSQFPRVGDWIVMNNTGNYEVMSDKRFHELYESPEMQDVFAYDPLGYVPAEAQ